MQYRNADGFIICVACNSKESFENIERWRNEIKEVEHKKPIFLVQTKRDLEDIVDEPVTFKQLKEKAKNDKDFQGAMFTSSK